jgi:hypothetical protein
MNQKGSTKIIIIILVVILAAVVGYLTLIKKPTPPTINQVSPTSTQIEQTPPTTSPTTQAVLPTSTPKDETIKGKPSLEELLIKSRNSVLIDIVPPYKARVFLYAPDEKAKLTKENEIYCFTPVPGLIVYSGNYKLILDASTLVNMDLLSANNEKQSEIKIKDSVLDIGYKEFNEEGVKTEMNVVSISKGLERNIIIVYQYSGCIYKTAYIYGYDLKKKSLVHYKFKYKNGEITDSVRTGLDGLSIEDYYLFIKYYNNATGRTEEFRFRFDQENGIFYEI